MVFFVRRGCLCKVCEVVEEEMFVWVVIVCSVGVGVL